MRVLAVHQDVIVFISAFWQTTCTAVRAGEEAFLIDSPVLPHEHDAVPQILESSSFSISALLATHADWDHLLGRLCLPDAALGCAVSSASRLRAELGSAQRELRDFDERNYIERPRPLALGAVQELPVPGKLDLGAEREIELVSADGHTSDGMGLWCDWLGLLVCGDYLSPVEIPWLSASGSAEGYLATLSRLEPYVARAEWVVPGHGRPLGRPEAQRVLGEDRAYLEAITGGGRELPLPEGRSGAEQRRIHAQNLAVLSSPA
jgi:glyoxylase-like metal-dependent hydrolase (beta-lactamase superfamily II)